MLITCCDWHQRKKKPRIAIYIGEIVIISAPEIQLMVVMWLKWDSKLNTVLLDDPMIIL